MTPHSEDPFTMPADSFMTPMVSIKAIQKHLSNKRHARLSNEDDQAYYFSCRQNRQQKKEGVSGQLSDPVLQEGVLLDRITRLHQQDSAKARTLRQQAQLLRIRNKEGLQEGAQQETAYFKNKSASLKKF